MKIDYAKLYGIANNKSDFTGAIKRSLNMGMMHFGKDFIESINKIRKEENL